MANYYARQISGEYFNYELYYGESCAKSDNFWAGGNREFIDINKELVENLLKNLEDYDYDCEQSEDEDGVAPEEEYYKLANYWFAKNDGSKFTEDDLRKLTDCRIEFARGQLESNDLKCKLLEIIYGEPFKHGTIRGDSQGDWMNYICPESMSDEYINWIEAVLFARGTEFEITEEPIDSPEDFDNANTFCDYTNEWREEDIRKWAADCAGCQPEEMKLILITGHHTYVKYDYKEV